MIGDRAGRLLGFLVLLALVAMLLLALAGCEAADFM